MKKRRKIVTLPGTRPERFQKGGVRGPMVRDRVIQGIRTLIVHVSEPRTSLDQQREHPDATMLGRVHQRRPFGAADIVGTWVGVEPRRGVLRKLLAERQLELLRA